MIFDSNYISSKRHIDPTNGYLRVDSCNITKTQVAPYLGREIPGWQEMGLEAEKIYYVLRPEDELKKAVPTFNNLPLTREHIEVDVDNVPKEKIVGSLGDHTEFVDGYLRNNLIIYDKKDIDLVMSGKKKELSCGYRYTPVRMAGDYKGQHYDFVMKDIVGNHVALVKEGRAGHDVVVSDTIDKVKEKFMSLFRKKEVVCDEFVESEHPRDKNGQFTNKSGGSSLKGNKDVENYWQGSGSKESQQSGKIGVMQKQLEDLKKQHKEILGKPMYVSLEDQEKAKYLEKDIKNLEDEIKKQKEQGYADWWNGLSEQDKKDAIMGLADKDPEIKELMGEKLYKDISEGGEKDSSGKSDLDNKSREEIEQMRDEAEEAYKEAVQNRDEAAKRRFKKDMDRIDSYMEQFEEEDSSGNNEIKKPNSNKSVRIVKNGDSYMASYGQKLNEGVPGENANNFQVLETKDFSSEKSAKKWANKVLELETTNDSKLDSAEQEKVGVVMKEFKEGELKSGSGEKVTDPKQAIAIALSEAGKAKDEKEIPDEQEKPEKARDEKALVKGEEEMTEEVKNALAEEKEEKVEETKEAEDEAKEEKLESKKDFAEGVEYGEEKEKEEPKKLDSEHESEGAKKADEKKAEKKEAEDEDEKKEDKEMAKDSALAMDIDAIKEAVRQEMKADFKAREDARKAVRSIVGDVNVMAFDSAEDIYKFACEQAGMDINEIASYKDAFKGLTAGKSRLALDASSISGSNEECFKDIRIA